MLENVYEGLNARSEVYLSKEYFCKMYPTCVSSKHCEFIINIRVCQYPLHDILRDCLNRIWLKTVLSFILGEQFCVQLHSSVRPKSFVLISIPFHTCSRMKKHEYDDLHLHPCVNDDGEKADTEYVEELEKFKQPHLDVRPWTEKSLQWELRNEGRRQWNWEEGQLLDFNCREWAGLRGRFLSANSYECEFRRTFLFKDLQLWWREPELRRQPADQSWQAETAQTMHYWLRPIKGGQFRLGNFASHFNGP